jgi:7-cyano-7-deazaguanine synthase
MEKALVLFSGGLDSTTALYWAMKNFDDVCTLSFNYGQRHLIELKMAQRVASKIGVSEHGILKVDLTQIGGSALTDPQIEVPLDRKPGASGIPITYVPFRNGIFISLATAWAEVRGIGHLVGGWNAVDFSGYPDCREEFLKAMERSINQGTKAGAEGKNLLIHAPLIHMTKEEIITLGLSLGADYSFSLSCYQGGEVPCGRCDSCVLRAKGWKQLGIMDHLMERLLREGKLSSKHDSIALHQ